MRVETESIATVRGGRVEPVDDDWGQVESRIELDIARFQPESLAGLEGFSHLVVVYRFHLADPARIEVSARHPRGNPAWPKVGIFAQRGKNRPNRLGVSTCTILGVDGTAVLVQGLDAIAGQEEPMSVEEMKNFVLVEGRIGTAGQPTESELRDAADAGYAAVINLGLLDPRYCLADEAGLVASLGLGYHHIPVQFDAPTVEDFRRFATVMDGYKEDKLLVHCAANYRVSSFVAVYGEWKLGWSRDKADAFARTLWPLNDTWADFLASCRHEVLTEQPK